MLRVVVSFRAVTADGGHLSLGRQVAFRTVVRKDEEAIWAKLFGSFIAFIHFRRKSVFAVNGKRFFTLASFEFRSDGKQDVNSGKAKKEKTSLIVICALLIMPSFKTQCIIPRHCETFPSENPSCRVIDRRKLPIPYIQIFHVFFPSSTKG